MCEWLRQNGLGDLSETFGMNKIKGESLLKMGDRDLEALGVKAIGTRILLKDGISKLREITKEKTKEKLRKGAQKKENTKNPETEQIQEELKRREAEGSCQRTGETQRNEEKLSPIDMKENNGIKGMQWQVDRLSCIAKEAIPNSKLVRMAHLLNRESPSSLLLLSSCSNSFFSSSSSNKVPHSSFSDSNSNENSSSNGGTPASKHKKTRIQALYKEDEIIPDSQELARFQIDFKTVRFIKLLGEGGFGKVFLGRFLGQEVAIKEFRLKEKEKMQMNFLKEVSVLSELRHPNILLYMGIITNHPTKCFMVTEFMERGSLYDHLHGKLRDKTVFGERSVFEMAKDIVVGMRYMIEKNYFHCDLKSSNILIDSNWSVKLCDFGLATRKRNHKLKGKIKGTPNWMAPEILRGKRFQEASDVYSFGLVLWYDFHFPTHNNHSKGKL